MKKVEYKLDTPNGVIVYRYLPKATKEIEIKVNLPKKIESQEEKDIKTWRVLFDYPNASFQGKFYRLMDALKFIRDTFDKYGAFNYKATLLTYVNGRLYDETNY